MHIKMTLFYSDYLEGCHPEILKRMTETNAVQTPGYGNDEFCSRAADIIRNACGAPDADVHFTIGGTQTNTIVISSLLRPFQGVICASTGHINVHETGAIEHSGHKVLPLPSSDGKITAAQVRGALDAHFTDASPEHTVQPGMVYISFPTELGTIYSRQELLELRKVCDDWELPLYIDGARLGYGLESEGCDLLLKDIAEIADAFYIGGTKQGALFGEAVVIRNPALKNDFRYCIKQNGALLAKGRLLGIQFETLFKEGLYFKLAAKADRLARRLSDAFAAAGYGFFVESHTNQIFPILPDTMAERLANDFGFEFWQKTGEGMAAYRFCTSWATTEAQIEELIAAI